MLSDSGPAPAAFARQTPQVSRPCFVDAVAMVVTAEDDRIVSFMNPTPAGKHSPAPEGRRRRGWVRGCRSLAQGCVLASLPALGAAHALSAAAAPAPAAAPAYADLSLEQLMDLKVERVYGASRQMQKVTQAPSSVSIVTADDIRLFGWRTLADVLRSVRGFYASDDRNYTFLGTRGFQRPGDYNTRVLVLVDGHRMNDNVYDGSYFGREAMVAVDMIERVEVIRGPSSSIYGSSAFFGVINIVTKRGSEVSAEVGTLGSYEGRFAFNHKFRSNLEWQFSGSYFTNAGAKRIYYPEFDQRISDNPAAANDGVAENADREDAAQLFTALSYYDFTLSAFVSRRLKEVPTASYGTVFNDGRERTGDRRAYVDAKFDRATGDHRVLGRVFYDQYRYSGQYPYDYAAPGERPAITMESDGAIGEWIGTEWQLNVRAVPDHAFIAGVEFRESMRERQYYSTTLDDSRRSRNLGLFGQWEGNLGKSLLLSGGLRYDHYFGSFGGTLNPRVAAIYSLTGTSTVKLLYGEAFRAPNPYERFYYTGSRTRTLQPERIRTEELVLEHYWGPAYRGTISLYQYDIKRLINQAATPAGDVYFENLDATHAIGGELEFEAKHASGLLARVSYAHQKAEDVGTGETLTNSPRSLAKLNLAWAAPRQVFSAGGELQFQSGLRTLAGARTGSAMVANLHVTSRRLVPGCELAITASNLFDRRYATPGAEEHAQDTLVQPGRLLWLKLTRKF